VSGDLLRVSEDFWNIRGSYRIGGVIDVGTQTSLLRRANGRFIFLDAYTLTSSVSRQVDELTNGGGKVEAILNLHPFHTVHVRKMHQLFPGARLYGTARHLERFPELPWEKARTESAAVHEEFADDLDFSIPPTEVINADFDGKWILDLQKKTAKNLFAKAKEAAKEEGVTEGGVDAIKAGGVEAMNQLGNLFSGEEHHHVLLGESADPPGGNGGAVGVGFVDEAEVGRQELPRPLRGHHDLPVNRAEVFRHTGGGPALIEGPLLEAHRVGADGLRHMPVHEGHKGAGVHSPGEKDAQGDVGNEA